MSVAPEPRSRADKRLYEPALDAPVPSRRCRCSTATLSSPAGDIVVLRVAGEVDATSFAGLDAALDDVVDRRPDHLIIDLTGLVSCSTRGLSAIADATRTATAHGARTSISGAAPPIARLWPDHWPDGAAPRIHETTAAAVLHAVALQAQLWRPVRAGSARTHPAGAEHDPDRESVVLREDADADPPGPDGDQHLPPRAHDTDPAALRLALHRHRRTMYRRALHALGTAYGAPPLAPDLATQLRVALAGLARRGPRE